jgi:hypothetical protein
MAAMSAQAVDTIVFDILGTVVDEQESVLAATTEALARSGFPDDAASARLASVWTAGLDRAVGDIAGGVAVWESNDVLRRRTLDAAIDAFPALNVSGSDRGSELALRAELNDAGVVGSAQAAPNRSIHSDRRRGRQHLRRGRRAGRSGVRGHLSSRRWVGWVRRSAGRR